jgi:hypothetical protein
VLSNCVCKGNGRGQQNSVTDRHGCSAEHTNTILGYNYYVTCCRGYIVK